MTPDFVPSMVNTSQRPAESFLGIGYSLLISAEQSGGAYELMKFVVPPGSGPPLHVHHNEDECFYLLEGELVLFVGDKEISATAGDFIHLPRGVPHRPENRSGKTAVFLCWVMPGNLAGFFGSCTVPWPSDAEQPPEPGKEQIGQMLEAAPKFNIEILQG